MKKNEMLSKMLLIATKAHHGQFDKGGKPYILHPLAVMQMMNTDDEELMCVALGHDLLEDTEIRAITLLVSGISQRVVDAITALTKVEGQSYEEYKQAVFANRDAMLVKRNDLKHNSQFSRLKGVEGKDIARVGKYMVFYAEIEARLQ
jgi:(p)ppGpp synthase/HD superfamily hydrolase